MSEYPLQFESDPTLPALAIASEGRKTMMAIIEENSAGDNEDEVANTAAHFEHLFSEIEDAMATCTTPETFPKEKLKDIGARGLQKIKNYNENFTDQRVKDAASRFESVFTSLQELVASGE